MIYAFDNGPANYLHITATGTGCNLATPNPDSSVNNQALTFEQARLIAEAAAFFLVTGNVQGKDGSTQVVAGAVIVEAAIYTLWSSGIWSGAPPIPATEPSIAILIPLQGSYLGTSYVQYLNVIETKKFADALASYGVVTL